MISPVAFRQYASYASYNRRVRKGVVKEELTDEQLAICTPILLGFPFERKIWGAIQRVVATCVRLTSILQEHLQCLVCKT